MALGIQEDGVPKRIRATRGTTADIGATGVKINSGQIIFLTDVKQFYLADTDNTTFIPIGGTGIATSSATSLTLAEYLTYVFTGSSATTWTLPAISDLTGRSYHIKNRGSANITLQRAGSDEIYDLSAVTSIVIAPGEAYIIQNDGTYWLVM